jgi:hypothetical protein
MRWAANEIATAPDLPKILMPSASLAKIQRHRLRTEVPTARGQKLTSCQLASSITLGRLRNVTAGCRIAEAIMLADRLCRSVES